MGNLGYLFLAYAAIWSGIFIYLVNIAKKLTLMEKEIKLLKEYVSTKN